MELQQAADIVKKLARGIDPITERRIEASIYDHPEVVRALFTVLEYLPKRRKSVEERRSENRGASNGRTRDFGWTATK